MQIPGDFFIHRYLEIFYTQIPLVPSCGQKLKRQETVNLKENKKYSEEKVGRFLSRGLEENQSQENFDS